MIAAKPVTLEGNGVRLEPLDATHLDGLAAAAADGRLWELWYTGVPEPAGTAEYIALALSGLKAGHMLPWVVRDLGSGAIVGTTRYHDMVAAIDRVEIGYTWYGLSAQRSHVNTTCKILLLGHAFEDLGCKVVGFRTDNFNFASQRAIAALGAKKDGVLRHHQARRDGSARDPRRDKSCAFFDLGRPPGELARDRQNALDTNETLRHSRLELRLSLNCSWSRSGCGSARVRVHGVPIPEVVVSLRLAPGVAVLILAVCAGPAPAATRPATPANVTIERERILMGTRCSVMLQGENEAALEAAATAAFETIARLEDVASNWREDSDLARFNAAARSARIQAAPPDLFDVLARSTEWNRRTGGAFDATVEPLTRAYDLRGAGRIPTERVRLQAAQLVRGAEVALDPGARTVTLPVKGMAFDLGGIAKGWAIDRAVETLRAAGVTRALVNFGGQVYALGAPVGAEAWTVQIASPLERGQGVVTLQLKDRSLSTSAASERSLPAGGTMLNHILDPRSGRPAAAWGSASAIAASATDADCASTALYVMGPEAGLAWARTQPDLEAVMLTPDPAAEQGVRIERAGGPVALLFPAAPALKSQGDAAGGAAGAPSNQELARRLDVLAGEVDDLKIGDAAAPAGESHSGLGPAASKVYGVKRGVSIGGYGEMLYDTFRKETDGGSPAGRSARLDFVRAVMYFGYKYSDRAVFNSEIEFEHGSTSLAGSVSVEFAYLDFLARPEFNLRAGMLLVPMGFINEMHEPPMFLTTHRPEVERNVLPSTWRANGAGFYGQVGNGLSYRAYVTEGLRGVADPGDGIGGFTAGSGPRGARQSGSESLFDDVALTGRVEWLGGGTRLGVSGFTGGTAQGATTTLGERFTARATMVEGHAEYKDHGWWFRALGARGTVDEADKLNDANGYTGDASVGSQSYGAYAQLSYDVLRLVARGSSLSLRPFVQYERYNTQHRVPAGFSKDPDNDRKSWTFGAAFFPDPQIVVKADYQNKWTASGSAVDSFGVALGFLF